MWKVIQNKDSLNGSQSVQFDHSLRELKVGDLQQWDLFPYKIQNRELFLDRNHPENINPESFSYDTYWDAFEKKCVEGLWVDDNGTWVYMMPKLFYYINYAIILGSEDGDEDNRKRIKPDLSSLEWVGLSYLLGVDGFSGFEDDDTYTCNYLVKRLFDGREVNKFEIKKLDANCYQPNGELKIYVDPWEYLTRFYLIDSPAEKPLGLPLYENGRQNGMFFGSRATAKSYITYVADFMHEWTFGGVRKYENIKNSNTRLLFAMGSGAAGPLNRSVSLISSFYDKQPGQFKYPDPKRPPQLGPFYKNIVGSWGPETEHKVKSKQGTDKLRGSSLQISVITPDKKRICAGDRFRRVYIEEAGFLPYITEVHAANKDSLLEGKKSTGSAIYTGTSGDLKAIAGPKKLFENPHAYSIFGIPNYWKNPDGKIGLFLPAYYKFREYKDPQGNNDLITALEVLSEERVINAEQMDSSSFDDYVMYAPITPDEMLRPNRRSFLPVAEAQMRLSDIDAYDYWNINANVGQLDWNPSEPYGVRFNKDTKNVLSPILEYNIDRSKIDIAGAYVLFEPPMADIPEGLYTVIYDPVSKPGKGESLDASLNVAFVYKGFYKGNEDTLEDGIVAEWVGREDDLYANYERVIKLAKYYNAKIFPETNTAGFVTWCRENDYGHMLQQEAYLAEQEINPNFRRRGAVGFNVYGDRKKPWLLQKLKSWLLHKRGVDAEGNFTSRNIDHILSTRLLDEIVNFNETGNFDYISALLGLMLHIAQTDKEDIELIDPYKEEEELVFKPQTRHKRRRSSFEQSIY